MDEDDGQGECVACDAVAQGYCWVLTTHPGESHAAACNRINMGPTARNVPMPWNAATLADLAEQIGCNDIGDYNNSAKSMWVSIENNDCGTHNFGDQYENYGRYSDQWLPVYTCNLP